MELVRATIKDIQTLLDIEKTVAGLKTYSGYFNEKEIEEWVSNETVYLVKNDDGAVAGSVSYEIKSEDHAHISRLVIKPEFQGQGLAWHTLLKLSQELKKFKRIDLAVHPDNTKPISLYNSLGFIVESRKENFYGDGEPRLIMVKARD